MAVVAGVSSMINTCASNVIGNAEDQEEEPVVHTSQMMQDQSFMQHNVRMEGEDEPGVPSQLRSATKQPTSVKTRKERKANQLMKEAGKRTRESLERMSINEENQNPSNQGS